MRAAFIVLWIAFWVGMAALAATEIAHWAELSSHQKFRLGGFCLFVPLAAVVGLGKLLRKEK